MFSSWFNFDHTNPIGANMPIGASFLNILINRCGAYALIVKIFELLQSQCYEISSQKLEKWDNFTVI